MKTLIVGYGSIGKRHARLLAQMVTQVAIVSSRPVAEYAAFNSLTKALSEFAPEYVVISSKTADHAQHLEILKKANYRGLVLVEKPLFMHAEENAAPYPFTVYVAYQLRFHPVVSALKQQMVNQNVLSVHAYVGQHLALWRPERNHKDTYSAIRAQGGGVLRDLSHEIDLMQYLFGPIEASQAMAGRVGNITLDSEDVAAFILRCKHCPVISLQMNCIDHVARREWIVNTEKVSCTIDLVKGRIAVNGEVTTIAYEADDAYRAMHKAVLQKETENVCTLNEGVALATFIDKVPLWQN